MTISSSLHVIVPVSVTSSPSIVPGSSDVVDHIVEHITVLRWPSWEPQLVEADRFDDLLDLPRKLPDD